MAIKIDEKYTKQVNSIMSKLPQNPFIIDVVGKAIEIGYENHPNKEDFGTILTMAEKITAYTSEYSSATSYKYGLIASILLAGVPYEKYESIDTASGIVKEYVELVTSFAFNSGWKDAWMQLNKLVQKDSDLLYVALVILITNLEDILSHEKLSIEDRYCLAGMGYLEASLRKSAITVPNRQYNLYNNFMTMIMKKAHF